MRLSISDEPPEKFLMKSDRGKDVRQQGERSLEDSARTMQGTGSAEVRGPSWTERAKQNHSRRWYR